ncbi:DUF1858 domain-containing protein [Lapidilactobacillus gannanensis]|jgi:hypothetical protein|uniref:DUF1858 domain-containing protein n=1 Tax=Lapidilactobacillus gannanensis TaxID=2486002 RepID=A0ABW4BQ90_9LACO|nr:DUF1858 domain-containing protein [Lapidilactobacillus gannanensis]MCH4057221.1 DUF1858 domain-containing protein [Lactobacillaceae bacterium]
MTMKKVSLDMTVYELVQQQPTIVPVMVALGLDGVTNPGLLQTAGRFMTLRKGAKMKSISISSLVKQLQQAGFEVVADDEK